MSDIKYYYILFPTLNRLEIAYRYENEKVREGNFRKGNACSFYLSEKQYKINNEVTPSCIPGFIKKGNYSSRFLQKIEY